jgi:hypothetical protein
MYIVRSVVPGNLVLDCEDGSVTLHPGKKYDLELMCSRKYIDEDATIQRLITKNWLVVVCINDTKFKPTTGKGMHKKDNTLGIRPKVSISGGPKKVVDPPIVMEKPKEEQITASVEDTKLPDEVVASIDSGIPEPVVVSAKEEAGVQHTQKKRGRKKKEQPNEEPSSDETGLCDPT